MEAKELDLLSRVKMAHAAVQAIGDLHHVDLLHIKGPAIHDQLRVPHRQSSDADVLVRPSQTTAFTDALLAHGWRQVTSFDTGSAFEHAANYHHTEWGYVDVHRRYPGITLDANAAFEALWVEADMTHIAQWPCPVLSVVDQALILALHAARGEGSMKSHADLDIAFTAQSPDFQAAVRSRAAQLGAELALAAALDELDDFRDDPAHDLWLVYSRGGTRAQEWRARWKATPDLSGRARVLAMLVGVNREYVAMELGHDPSRAEMRSAFWQRIRNGLGLKRRSVHLRPPQ